MSTTHESHLVGLIGQGVLPSLTPALHEREADHHGIRYLYRPLDLDLMSYGPAQVGNLVRAAAEFGYTAFNVTHPCKQLVMDSLDEASEDTQRLGAANTVLVRDGKLIGHNTDFSGFSSALATGLPGVAVDRVVQLGAGGAGSAVSYALLAAGVSSLSIADLDVARAEERATVLSGLFPNASVAAFDRGDIAAALADANGFVHATPVGMHSHPGMPIDATLLRPDLWVADVVYRPLETELVRTARNLGCQVLDGGYMAVGQAADAFSLITGISPDRERMRRHFLELIAEGR